MLKSNLRHKSFMKTQVIILNCQMVKCIRKSLQTNSSKTFHFYREVTMYLLKQKPKVCYLKRLSGNSLVVKWLGLCAFTAENPGSNPDWGTKISQMVGCGPKQKETKSLQWILTLCFSLTRFNLLKMCFSTISNVLLYNYTSLS